MAGIEYLEIKESDLTKMKDMPSASNVNNLVQNAEIKKQSSYVKTIRKFNNLQGISLYTDNGVTTEITPENTLKIKLNNSTDMNRVLIDLNGYGEGFLSTEKRTFGLAVKFTNSDKLSYMNVMLMSNATNINTLMNTSIQSTSIYEDGLYEIPLYDKDFSVTAGLPDVNMNFMRLDILPVTANSTGTDLEIEIIKVVKFKPKKSKCMISFDDGHESCLDIANLLEDRNLRGTFYIYTDGINETGNLSLSDIRTMSAIGHDISVHSVTHESAVTLGDSQYFYYQQEARKWIRELVSSRAADHAAFVGGHSTETLRSWMNAAGFKSTRNAVPLGGFVHSGFGTNFENKYENPRFKGNTYEMHNLVTVNEMIDAHQFAIDNNQDFFVYGHQLLETATAQAWDTSLNGDYSMSKYFDWIKSKVDDGSIEVLTVSQFWNEFED